MLLKKILIHVSSLIIQKLIFIYFSAAVCTKKKLSCDQNILIYKIDYIIDWIPDIKNLLLAIKLDQSQNQDLLADKVTGIGRFQTSPVLFKGNVAELLKLSMGLRLN